VGVHVRSDPFGGHDLDLTFRRNHKPSESDMEDDSDDGEDDDPSSWFEDDQDDGRKGQDIVNHDSDDEDLSHIIRIDDSKIPGGVFPP
jgi:hypothetical protein